LETEAGTKYYELIDALTKWNLENPVKKHVLFICHSFQMACKHFVWQKSRKGTILPCDENA
jgi:hypothetical protein